MSEKKSNRGGARAGAGRPHADTVESRVRLPRDVDAKLRAIGNGNLKDGIVLAAQSVGEPHKDVELVNPQGKKE